MLIRIINAGKFCTLFFFLERQICFPSVCHKNVNMFNSFNILNGNASKRCVVSYYHIKFWLSLYSSLIRLILKQFIAILEYSYYQKVCTCNSYMDAYNYYYNMKICKSLYGNLNGSFSKKLQSFSTQIVYKKCVCTQLLHFKWEFLITFHASLLSLWKFVY